MDSRAEISFEIKERVGVICTYDNGWSKEVNVVSWNGSVPKVDVRDWSPDHQRMTKGITLHEEEARGLVRVLADRYKEV